MNDLLFFSSLSGLAVHNYELVRQLGAGSIPFVPVVFLRGEGVLGDKPAWVFNLDSDVVSLSRLI
jgi:hypothetical protein